MSLLTPLLLLLMIVFCLDNNVRKFLYVLVAFYLFDLIIYKLLGSVYFYERHLVKEVIVALVAYVTLPKKQFYIILAICSVWFGLLLNEYLNEYQTIFYPYLNTIMFWLYQLLLVVIVWKTKWRKTSCLYSQKKC
jgi:hypothetical protein